MSQGISSIIYFNIFIVYLLTLLYISQYILVYFNIGFILQWLKQVPQSSTDALSFSCKCSYFAALFLPAEIHLPWNTTLSRCNRFGFNLGIFSQIEVIRTPSEYLQWSMNHISVFANTSITAFESHLSLCQHFYHSFWITSQSLPTPLYSLWVISQSLPTLLSLPLKHISVFVNTSITTYYSHSVFANDACGLLHLHASISSLLLFHMNVNSP